MSKIQYTGNDFLDRLIAGPYVKNPNFDPKTKKGREQPEIIVDTTPGDIEGGGFTKTADKISKLSFTGRDVGFTNEEIKSDADMGITLSPYNTEDELNKARADNQSFFEQAIYAQLQAGIGEILLGTLEGFGDIADGIINTFTGDQYGVNPYTRFMKDARESLKEKLKIYRENPNSNFDMSDSGWWWDNYVSIASTLSLFLPAAGWAKALSMAGKISKLGKVGNFISKASSRGIAKAMSKMNKIEKGTDSFNAIRKTAITAGKIDRTIKNGTNIIGTAALSRAGENYMEASAIYDDVYKNSKENLDNMPDEEFTKFLKYNPNFKDMSKDDIAKEIAKTSANKTFYNDWWMLLMDIPQFKAIGSVWGKHAKRTTKASERIALENQKKLFAGVEEDKLIKNNFINRTKNEAKYALTHPIQSLRAMELSEGVEEMYQGIQSEKGMERAAKFFDTNLTSRSLESYLSDGSIWEQGFWGALGGIGFNLMGKGFHKAKHKVKGLWNKKHMTAEDYELWKRSTDKIAIEQLNNINSDAKQFIFNMNKIENGENPFEFVKDAKGDYIIKDGKYKNVNITEEEKDALKEESIRRFVDSTTVNAVDYNTLDLMKELLNSNEFNQYLTNNGVQLTAVDKALNNQITDRMDEVSNIYYNALNDVANLAEDTNPYITRAVARNIVQNNLNIDDYESTLDNLYNELDKITPGKSDVIEELYSNKVLNQIEQLSLKEKEYLNKFNDKEISLSAYELHKQELNRTKKALLNSINNELSIFDDFKNIINTKDYDVEKAIEAYKEALKQYKTEDDISYNNLPETEKNLVDQIVDNKIKLTNIKSKLPITKKDYEDLYNEFAFSMDNIMNKKVKNSIKLIENYLRNAENIDEAINNIIDEKVNNKLRDALAFIKYGYFSENFNNPRSRGQLLANAEVASIINKIKKERKDNNQREEEAKEQGVELPTNDNNPSTGEETITDSNNIDNSDNTNTNKTNDNITGNSETNNELETIFGVPENNPITDKEIPIGENPITVEMDEKEIADLNTIAESYASDSLKALLDGNKFVMQKVYTESGRIDEINKKLSEGDPSAYNNFINEIVEFLKIRGYNEQLSQITAKKSFSSMIASLAAMDNKSTFAKLAQQLVIGFNKESAKKFSITELIDNKGLDNIIEEFLNEFSKIIENNEINGTYIINLNTLFDYILNKENIDIQTASYIYENIGKYIASHDGSKYIFTGFNPSKKYSAERYFNEINERKAQVINSVDSMHISPIETDQRNEDYYRALESAANGSPTFIKMENNTTTGDVNTFLAIYVNIKKGKKTVPVKIGILRTVKTNSDLSKFSPVKHYSGFRNEITKTSNSFNLDCDFLFDALINNDTTEANELFNILVEYNLIKQKINKEVLEGTIDPKTANEQLEEFLNSNKIESIFNNELIKKLLQSGVYKVYKGELLSGTEIVDKIFVSISNILFYNKGFSVDDSVNDVINNMSIDKKTIKENYNIWKQKIYTNYKQTYELQKNINDENTKVNIKVNISYTTLLNDIDNPEDYVNIEDAGFDIDRNSPNYTPFVMVNSDGTLIDEYGNTYGKADIDINSFSAGFLVHNEDGVKYVAYCNTAQTINNSELHKDVRQELAHLIIKQLNNKVKSLHEDNFNDIFNKITELFGKRGLFIFNNFNTFVLADKAKSMITVTIKNNDGTKTNLLTFYRSNKDGSDSNVIGLYIPRLGKQIMINSIKDINHNNEKITEQEIKDALKYAIDTAIGDMKLNKSLNVLTKTGPTGAYSNFQHRENGKFIVTIGGKTRIYESYGDFMLKNRAFNTNVDGTANGFVTRYLNEDFITIDTIAKDTSKNVQPKNTFVSDLLFNNKNKKRKTVDTKDILEAAGVPQDKIDVLLGTNSKLPILVKRVNSSLLDDGETNAYYDPDDKNIYITQKGAISMNNNPTNAIRILLHENLHRLFHNKKTYTDKQRQRIINELKEVYDYTKKQLLKDIENDSVNKDLYKSIRDQLEKATSSNDKQVQMEEFLVECLTQPVLVQYLNNTNYHSEVVIDGIPQKSKSIFQKIIDILLDLFGIKTNHIKNNSILAREYMILSKNDTSTDDDIFNKPIKTDNNSSPVEEESSTINNNSNNTTNANNTNTNDKLKAVRQKINEIRYAFEKRIKRSDNFKEDHTYLIDGKPVDYSVTQRINGKKDLGRIGIPSSLLGNTADDAARIFFENNGYLPDDHNIPNFTNKNGENSRINLEKDLNKIKDYLDKRFGKGRYGVITEEFPIGGIINTSGIDKTIAGTMDMIVYTDSGDIYIFDFKTKRFESNNGEFFDSDLKKYTNQVNIYRQLIEANFPELRGKIKIGGLIKFIVNYPEPNSDIKYRENPDVPNQLQIKGEDDENFINIQDSYADYLAPFFFPDEDFETSHIINVESKDFVDEIKSLPELNNNDTKNIEGSELIQDDNIDEDFDFDSYDPDDYDWMTENPDDIDIKFKSATDLIERKDMKLTSTEIYATDVADGSNDNAYGIKLANDMVSYINTFPRQYRKNTEQLLADNELNYTCQ